MASRFYLSHTTLVAGSITPGFAAWTRTTEGDRREMSVTKDGSALTNKSVWAGGAAAANATALCRQFISAPMAAGIGFVTTDTIKGVVRVIESAANDNINRQPICLKVYAADGTTLQATLKALGHIGPATTEWVVTPTLTNRRFADGDTLDANYTTVAGDRLVLELGGQVSASAGTSVTGNMNFGSSAASDLAENETSTTANNPWFEISRDVTFLAPEEEETWVGGPTQSFVGIARSLAAAALFTAAVAQAAGGGWLPDEGVFTGNTNAPNISPPVMLAVVDEPIPVLRPWLGGEDELPFLYVDQDAYRPEVRAPWYSAGTVVGADQDEYPYVAPTIPGDEGAFFPRVFRPATQVSLRSAAPDHADPPLPGSDEGAFQPEVRPPWRATVLPVGPDQDEYPTPPPAPIYDEDGYQPPLPVAFRVPALSVVDPDELPGPSKDEGEYLPLSPVVWLAKSVPLPDQDEYPTPAVGLVGDEGAVVFGTVAGGIELVPPPAGGFGPADQAVGPGVEDDPYLPLLLSRLPVFSDPALLLPSGDDLSIVLDEEGYQPSRPVWGWVKPILPMAGLDEYPSGVAPTLYLEDEPYRPVVVVPWLAPVVVVGQPDEYPTVAPTLYLEESEAPTLRAVAGWVKPILLFGEPDVLPRIGVDEGVFPVPAPLPVPVQMLPVPVDPDPRYLGAAVIHALTATISGWGLLDGAPLVFPPAALPTRPPKGRYVKAGPFVAAPAPTFYTAKAESEWRRSVEQKVLEMANAGQFSGDDHATTDYALSAGWGTTASVSAVAATDRGGRVTCASAGTGQAANPTVTLTFKNGAYQAVPAVACSRGDTNSPTTAYWIATASRDGVVFTFVGTPVAGTSYTFDFTVVSNDRA